MADADVPRPQLSSRNLVRLLDYWEGRRADRLFPARRDIDPIDISYLLGKIVLVDALYEPLRFRYRLVGVDVVQNDGFDMTGKLVDDFPEPEYREFLRASFAEVIMRRRPLSSVRELFVDGRPRRYEVLRLPLSDDGDTINMLLYATEYLR